MEKCKYRNCNKELTGRKGKIYCNRNCKSYERIYLKREKMYFEEKIKFNKKLIEEIKFIENLIKGDTKK